MCNEKLGFLRTLKPLKTLGFLKKGGVLKTRVFGKRAGFLKTRVFGKRTGFLKMDGVFENGRVFLKMTSFAMTSCFKNKYYRGISKEYLCLL